jgi:hypothetical protein
VQVSNRRIKRFITHLNVARMIDKVDFRLHCLDLDTACSTNLAGKADIMPSAISMESYSALRFTRPLYREVKVRIQSRSSASRPLSALDFQALVRRSIGSRWPFRPASSTIGESRDNGDAVVAVVVAVGCAGLVFTSFPSS